MLQRRTDILMGHNIRHGSIMKFAIKGRTEGWVWLDIDFRILVGSGRIYEKATTYMKIKT